jgi:hypothetical protein
VQIHQGGAMSTVDMFNGDRTANAIRLAEELANSTMIPDHFRGNRGDCLLALYESARHGMSPLEYMAVTYRVGGRITHEAKFIVAKINSSGRISGVLKYEFSGEIIRGDDLLVLPKSTRKCTAWAIWKETGERIEQSIDMKTAFLEGWTERKGADGTKRSNKWHTMPDVMLQYRAAKFFGNMYTPDLTMGMVSREEAQEIQDAETVAVGEVQREIFVKGAEVNTEPEPVFNPAKQVVVEAEVVQPEPTAAEAPQTERPAATTETTVEQAKVPETLPEGQALTNFDLPEEPPVDVDEFRSKWWPKWSEKEGRDLDVFLLGKKWLKMGETATDMSSMLLANLRSKWPSFFEKYQEFKLSRKS